MQPTSLRLLAQFGVVAFSAAFVALFSLNQFNSSLIPVGFNAVVGIGLVDLALLAWIYSVKDRLPTSKKNAEGEVQVIRAAMPLPNLVAARTAALALAASRSGAVLSGIYFASTANAAIDFHVVAAQQTFWNSLIAGIFSIALIWLGLWLERLCRLPNSRPE